MSVLPPESIKVIALSVGISNLSDEVASALAADVEYRLRELAQEAMKFMRHSKRDVLSTTDVNNALRLRNIEGLYGFSTSSASSSSSSTGSNNINNPFGFVRCVGVRDVFYLSDTELNFNEVMNAPLPPCPRDVTLSAHWLAIEGVQPSIRQNPSPEHVEKMLGESSNNQTKKRKRTSAIDKPAVVKPIVKHVLSKELQLYYENITSAIINCSEPSELFPSTVSNAIPAATPSTELSTSSSTITSTAISLSTTNGIDETNRGAKKELLKAALNSLSHDPGLAQLLPYFIQFICDEVTHNLRKLPLLRSLLKMVRALLESPHLHIEPYLHQLMPAILTCLVGRRLCENPMENHWKLREEASTLVAFICKRYGSSYFTLQPRITKTLLHAFLDPTKALTTHYGAIVGLSTLGPYVIELLVLPNISHYYSLLQPELNSPNPIKCLEARKCYAALLKAAGIFLSEKTKTQGKLHFPAKMDSRPPTPMETEDEEKEEGEDDSNTEDEISDNEKNSNTEDLVQEKEKNSVVSNAGDDSDSIAKKSKRKKPKILKGLESLLPENTPTYYKQLFEIFGESLNPFISNTNEDVSMSFV